jgi:hypothetical protein
VPGDLGGELLRRRLDELVEMGVHRKDQRHPRRWPYDPPERLTLGTSLTDVTVRPITGPEELNLFCRFPQVLNAEVTTSTRAAGDPSGCGSLCEGTAQWPGWRGGDGMATGAQHPECSRFLSAGWHEEAAERRAVENRMAALTRTGAELTQVLDGTLDAHSRDDLTLWRRRRPPPFMPGCSSSAGGGQGCPPIAHARHGGRPQVHCMIASRTW